MKINIIKGITLAIIYTSMLASVGCNKKSNTAEDAKDTTTIEESTAIEETTAKEETTAIESTTLATNATNSEITTNSTTKSSNTSTISSANVDALTVFKMVFNELGFDSNNLNKTDITKLKDYSNAEFDTALQKTATKLGLSSEEISNLYKEGMISFLNS